MMPKFLVVFILIFPMYIFADDNPREDDEGGKLSDMENAKGNSDNFLIYLLIDIMINSPEVFFGSSTTYSYSDYPYKNNAGLFEENNTKTWHLDADFAYLKESASLNAINFDVNINPSRYWSMKVKYFRFTERFNFEESQLDLSEFFIQYNRVRRERFNLQWGIGLINMVGEKDRSGLALDLGCELFIYNPISIESNYVFGYLEDAMFSEFDAKINLYRKRFNLFAGYKYISVANVSLNNLMLGIGVNF